MPSDVLEDGKRATHQCWSCEAIQRSPFTTAAQKEAAGKKFREELIVGNPGCGDEGFVWRPDGSGRGLCVCCFDCYNKARIWDDQEPVGLAVFHVAAKESWSVFYFKHQENKKLLRCARCGHDTCGKTR